MDIHTVLIILISAALAFGIYGVVVQRGANLVRFDRRAALMALIWGLFELGAALAGYGIGCWIVRIGQAREDSEFWLHIFAGGILICIGVRMLVKAFQSRNILEHRMENVDIRADALLALRLCIHGCFAGIVCGLLWFPLLEVMIAAFALTAVFAVLGYMSGRIWGVSPSGKAYAIGGGLMCAIAVALQLLEFV